MKNYIVNFINFFKKAKRTIGDTKIGKPEQNLFDLFCHKNTPYHIEGYNYDIFNFIYKDEMIVRYRSIFCDLIVDLPYDYDLVKKVEVIPKNEINLYTKALKYLDPVKRYTINSMPGRLFCAPSSIDDTILMKRIVRYCSIYDLDHNLRPVLTADIPISELDTEVSIVFYPFEYEDKHNSNGDGYIPPAFKQQYLESKSKCKVIPKSDNKKYHDPIETTTLTSMGDVVFELRSRIDFNNKDINYDYRYFKSIKESNIVFFVDDYAIQFVCDNDENKSRISIDAQFEDCICGRLKDISYLFDNSFRIITEADLLGNHKTTTIMIINCSRVIIEKYNEGVLA